MAKIALNGQNNLYLKNSPKYQMLNYTWYINLFLGPTVQKYPLTITFNNHI